jgi:hypothetical protein
MTAAEALNVVQTPAYKAALRLLMERGTWVPKEHFANLGHTRMATENALADLVMLSQAVWNAHTGYRLAQRPVVRAAVRELMVRPDDLRFVEMVHDAQGVQVGIALRRGPDVLDVATAGLEVPNPPGASADECLQMAAGLPALLWNTLEAGVMSHA